MYHLFCFGLSRCASKVIDDLSSIKKDAWKYSATYYSKSISSDNIQLYDYNLLKLIPNDVTHILISIPPQEIGDIVYLKFRQQIINLKHIKWIGYLSTTGVYGNKFGGWVNEESVVKPTKYQSMLRVTAENQWISMYKQFDIPINIFRLSGIYDFNHNEIKRILTRNVPIIIKENQYFSRIHVEDIAQTLIKSFRNEGEIFNLADDYPSSSSKVVSYAYKLLNINPPLPIRFQDANLSEMALSFYLESRRVDNNKVKRGLNIQLKYPTFIEGLNAIYTKMNNL